MKIDRSKLKKSSSEVSADCQALIERLKTCPDLLSELQYIKTWNYGKSELYQWVDVLDRFDTVLQEACQSTTDQPWHLVCDHPDKKALEQLVHSVLTFTALLVEHSFSRHLYNSVEHLTALLASSNLNTVLAVLNLVYVFSKRSNFLIKLSVEKRQDLFHALTFLAESWGGKDNGFGLAECCLPGASQIVPDSATTLHFEFYSDNLEETKSMKRHPLQALTVIHLEHVDKLSNSCAAIMENLLRSYSIPKEKQMLLFTHVRLAHCFSTYEKRLLCVQARLQALSVLVYSSAIQEITSTLLYSGLVEELVDVLQLDAEALVEIKAASLRTLTSVIHLDRNPELVNIIEATGAASFHGFLPVLVRQCIQSMIDPNQMPVPHVLATALFSFLYHLASYETGGEALVSCNMMESLLKVIKWHGEDEQLHTTFVTRAVRVVDLITNLDMAAFQTNSGLSVFLNRLEHEVNRCREDVPYVIRPAVVTSKREPSISDPASPISEAQAQLDSSAETAEKDQTGSNDEPCAMETDSPEMGPSTSGGLNPGAGASQSQQNYQPKAKPGVICFPQRSALLKSMLNFLKKAIPDPAFADSIRHVMDGPLPTSLKHIISNAEYYGPSLFLLACEFVTVYVFQEPSLLSSLQDTGLTDVMLHALLIKDVPATKEVLGSLPNIFSALCLNARGLEAFVKCKPFDKLFKVLLSPAYLPAMRRRRSNEIIGDTALSLGSAMDELMRHQPSLKCNAMKSIIKLLEEICALGRDPRYTCAKAAPKPKTASATIPQTTDDNMSSEEEDDEEEVNEDIRSRAEVQDTKSGSESPQFANPEEKKPIPLLDYIFNVMKFVEAILCTNATDDHCWEFVGQKGHVPLMQILCLPNLPTDFPSSPACQSVTSVCKAIMSLAREPQVLKQGLLHLDEVLRALDPLHQPQVPPAGSILLRELLDSSEAPVSSPSTPLLQAIVATHSYVTMLFHVCKVGQGDVRTISINQWGTDLGQKVLKGLCQLYTSLVWESIVLLSLFTPGSVPDNCELGKPDIKKLLTLTGGLDTALSTEPEPSNSLHGLDVSPTAVVSSALSSMEVDDSKQQKQDDAMADSSKESKMKMNLQMLQQLKQAVPALYAPSRLGRALSELFGLLVKLCVGSSVRHRTRPHPQSNLTVPSESARNTAQILMELLSSSLKWQPPMNSLALSPKFRMTFLICAVSFASPMLFDEKKQPYHLMLQKFVTSGAHAALFEAFDWAIHQDDLSSNKGTKGILTGTSEFLEAWLGLMKKMVNPDTVLDSPHAMPVKSTQQGFVPFSAPQFLINTHKATFWSLLKLWHSGHLKFLGIRTSESVLAMICHILRGESIVSEKLKLTKTEDTASTSAGEVAAGGGLASLPGSSRLGGTSGLFASSVVSGFTASRPNPEPSEEHITQLLDMGFPRDHAIDALRHSASLEQAAEWALSHPPRITQDFGTGLSEEEEMMQAIAMSLGEALQTPRTGAQEQQQQDSEEEKKKKEEEEKKRKELEQKQLVEREKIPEEEPLTSSELDEFGGSMLPGCLQLMDDIPDIVARVCDLLVIANERKGEEWRDQMLETIIQQIAENASYLANLAAEKSSEADGTSQISVAPEALKLATRIHLFCLLFDEMKMSCAKMMEKSGVLGNLVSLLHASHTLLSSAKAGKTPKWLAPLLLLIDLYEKAVVTFRRKLVWIKNASHQWKWFEDSSGRWCTYSRGNNKTIDDAYWAGKTSVRFTAARKKYIVYFNKMVQANEETSNRRPIMQAPKVEPPKEEEKENDPRGSKKLKTIKDEGASVNASLPLPSQEVKPDEVAKEPEIVEVKGLTEEQITSVLRSCVGLIGVTLEPDCLHAVLRLCLRFTRNHLQALLFAELGGPRLLLSLTNKSAFTGFSLIATLLIRHIFESSAVLTNTMEKLVSTVANKGVGCLTCNVALGSIGSRELHFALRMLGPASCRDEQIYQKTAINAMKIALPHSKRVDDDLSHYTGPNALQLLKSNVTPETHPSVTVDGPTRHVLSELLDALVVPQEEEENKETVKDEAKEPTKAPNSTAEQIGLGLREIGDDLLCFNPVDRLTVRAAPIERLDATSATEDVRNLTRMQGTATTSTSGINLQSKSKALLSKSSILRLLAEIVKPYVGYAELVAQYQFVAGTTPHVKEDGSVLAYILDHLLPNTQKEGDKECPAQAQVFLASLATCNHSPDAQATLVTEVKLALQRALTLPESKEKHARIQALALLVSVMIEACPSTTNPINQTFLSTLNKNQSSTVNNMIRLLLKKGFVTDLARIAHNLDLSSPNMAATVNAALKPLDTLSRIVNQAPSRTKTTSKSHLRDDHEGGVSRTRPDDGDTVRSGSVPTRMDTQEQDLADIVDELLEHEAAGGPTVLGETLIASGPERLDSFQSSFLSHGDQSQDEMVITMTEDGGDLDPPPDSEMRSQPSHEEEEEEEPVLQEFDVGEDNDSAGDSESDRAEDEAQDDDVDDDEEEEEDEDDADDDESDMEAEEYDITEDLDYFRMGERDRDDDFFIRLDDIFPGTASAATQGITSASANHPLLIRNSSEEPTTSHATAQTNRMLRPGRQRFHFRQGNGASQTVHIYHSPVNRNMSMSSLLRMLGISSSNDIVQLSQTGNQARIFLANANRDIQGAIVDDIFNLDEGFREPLGYLSNNDLTSNVTPVYKRWDEEASILDGESMYDCVEALKGPIIEELEKRRDQELAERMEKLKKQAEEDAKKKKELEKVQKKLMNDNGKTKEETKVTASAAGGSVGAAAAVGSSAGAAGGTGMEAAKEEVKKDEDSMEISDNGERTSGEPSSSASEGIGEGPISDLGEDHAGLGELAASVAASALSEALPSSTSTFVEPATPPVTPPSRTPQVPSIVSFGAPVDATTTTGTTQPSVLPPVQSQSGGIAAAAVTAAISEAMAAVSDVLAASSSAASLASSVTIPSAVTMVTVPSTTQASTPSLTTPSSRQHPFSSILSTTGEVTLNSLLAGTAGVNIGAASTTNLASGARAPAAAVANLSGAAAVAAAAAEAENATGAAQDQAGTGAPLQDLQLPEGVDPSFLAALPDNIRQEVLRDHLGIRNPPPPDASAPADPNQSISQVNPEFLAALPLHIQEEVLADERAEQQRVVASQQTTSTAAEPIDPAAFIQNLPSSLRQTVLADMDDSVIAVLPPALAEEAQALRVLRNRQLVQERLVRESGRLPRGQGVNYYRMSVPRSAHMWSSGAVGRGLRPQSRLGGSSGLMQIQGRQLVDLEALTCLLVLLFLNEPKLNLVRLWRVLRNLSFHPPTRNWIIQSLLSILERTKSCKVAEDYRTSSQDATATNERLQSSGAIPKGDSANKHIMQPSWLSVSMDAALGCRASIFQVQRGTKKSYDKQGAVVYIHPQAASMVCQNVLDTLYALADDFPQQFIPEIASRKREELDKLPKQEDDASQEEAKTLGSAENSSPHKSSKSDPEFWDLLVKLDSTSLGRKGKASSKPTMLSSTSKDLKETSWEDSPTARLLAMLAHPVIKHSTSLTDKLLHLLTLVTASLPQKEKDIEGITGTSRSQGQNDLRTETTATSTMAISVPSCQATDASQVMINPATGAIVTHPATGTQQGVSGRSQPVAAPEVDTPQGEPVPPSRDVSSPMETSVTEESDTQRLDEEEPATSKKKDAEKTLVDERLLQLAVDVLTTHTCSEDGLEEATTLLMQLSRGHSPTRESVLRLLLSGAQQLGQTLSNDIDKLMSEVNIFINKQREQENGGNGETDDVPGTSQGPGTLSDRFNQGKNVVIHLPSSGSKRTGFELRLPSMVLFTRKTSNQTFFLRMLKVVIQLREVAKKVAADKAKQAQLLGAFSDLGAAVTALATSASDIVVTQRNMARPADQASHAISQGVLPVASSVTTPSTANTPGLNTLGSITVPQPVSTSAASSTTATPSTSSSGETPMEVDQSQAEVAAAQSQVEAVQSQVEAILSRAQGTEQLTDQQKLANNLETKIDEPARLSFQLGLNDLWDTVSACLTLLSQTPDPHAVLVLQPAVEAFFLVHASEKSGTKARAEPLVPVQQTPSIARLDSTSGSEPPTPSQSEVPSGFFTRESSVVSVVTPEMPPDTQKFLQFAEKHRSVLNQILRQSTVHLSEGPFAVLVNHVRILDFDVKRRYFRQELERVDEGMRREDMAIHVRREHVFEDSYRELHRKSPEQWKDKFYVVFEGEEGQDAGGLLREWYLIISKEIFNPMYALFKTSPGDRVTYIPNPASHCNSNHLSYFKFVGRIIAKAIYDNKLLECYFSRSFYKHILGKAVTYTDMESEDYAFYQGLIFLLEHDISELGYELTFSTEIVEFGVTETRDLKPNGANIVVTTDNKHEYVHRVCQMKMTGAIRKQINSFLEGFYDIIPKRLISIFNEQELELLISGLPTVDVDDLKANTEYHKYQGNSLQIQWFWRGLRSFDQALRAKFIQFVTGTSKVPLQGFGSLEGMNGPQKFQIHRDDRSTDRLPTAHTCFNQLDLPAYETYDKLRQMLLIAIEECPEGFGLA